MAYKSNFSKADRTHEAIGFPSVVLIDNCNACNLRCSMCDHPNMKQYRKVEIMDFGLYRRLIDEIAREKPDARVWEIFFGDPFMCRDMAKRIAYAKEKGLQDVVLNTNGVLMSADRAKGLIQAGLDVMYVGIDAFTAETYGKIRIGGDFQKVVDNTLRYRDLLNQYGTDRQKLFVQYVVSEVNQHEVAAFKAFWKTRGVSVKVRPKLSWAGLVRASNLYDNSQVKRKPCYWLMQTINICADGKVALCSVDVHCRVSCGDVKRHSIKEIWEGSLKEYRNLHKAGRFEELPPMCHGCADWQSGYADFVLAESSETAG